MQYYGQYVLIIILICDITELVDQQRRFPFSVQFKAVVQDFKK